ncbi:glycoside hydrolase family 3 N-terminal domain-containing protein [uncultured Bacteroides sp.]|uniref:glycoside hydrolase family 3 N-terminal domain-containing protein n=1 Tax=uncultured Bacteroides sp. TaxID=162156 RepID=UPI0025D77049|nr:glycoside hydrolase family 3 N-terminal domain-containing protein [uncultured Bacteroides sp.]
MRQFLFWLLAIVGLTSITAIHAFPQKFQSDIFSKENDKIINQIIAKMTLEEKAHQLATQFPNANTRMGIRHMTAGECLHGVLKDSATIFPQAIAMASTWNPELIERMGHIVAKESRAFGIHQCYTPMLGVVRDIRWGRTEESYGEDPYLVGKIGAAYIRGLQGIGKQRFDPEHIIATAKHFVADGEPMAGDNGAAHDVSDYTLHNIHLYPFRLAIEEARVGSIMPAHHLLNGIPCHANKEILIDVLRKQYGWDGLVVSDNGDLRAIRTTFNYADTPAEVAKMGLEAGVHQELAMFQKWNSNRMYGDNLVEAVKAGIVPVELVDDAVKHVLRAKFELGLFNGGSKGHVKEDERFDVIKNPKNTASKEVSQSDAEMFEKANYIGNHKKNWRDVVLNPEHDKFALKVAHQSVVLLKNSHNILPLRLGEHKKIAVIGPNANAVRIGGYSPRKQKRFISIYEGIRQYVGQSAQVSFSEGCDFNGNTDKIAAAVALAQTSDLVILAIGGSEETCRENQDVDNLDLPANQQELERTIKATGKPYVVILLGGRPASIEYTAKNADAILEGWYLGQETGHALADILFGKINPSGKLPITFPRNVGQVPLFYNKLETGRPRNIYKSNPSPLYPFGYGLSYTTFDISAPVLTRDRISTNEETSVKVTVTNTGSCYGEETVQLYINDLVAGRVRPKLELRNFVKVGLNPGESRQITIPVGRQQLEYWNNGAWRVEPGQFVIMVGANSVDLKKAVLTVL